MKRARGPGSALLGNESGDVGIWLRAPPGRFGCGRLLYRAVHEGEDAAAEVQGANKSPSPRDIPFKAGRYVYSQAIANVRRRTSQAVYLLPLLWGELND